MYNCYPTLYSGSTDTAAAGRLRTCTRYILYIRGDGESRAVSRHNILALLHVEGYT